MKNLLVPTDFSASSLTALKYAGKLAIKLNAHITILHCCELFNEQYTRYKTHIREHNKTVVSKIRRKLTGLQKMLQSNYGIKSDICLDETGSVVNSILHTVKDQKIDLVIMGSYGAKGLRRKLFGSKAADIINKSPVPVITLPPAYRWNEHNEFVICVDDVIEDMEATKPFLEIAKVHNGKVFVAIFSEESDPFGVLVETKTIKHLKRKINTLYPFENLEIIHLVGKDFYHSIREFITEKKIDLLSMITYKRSLLQQIFDRSMTQKMSYQNIIPLLSLHKSKFEDVESG